MKIAAFSDVHANYAALESVLCEIKKHDPDQIIFLGDIFTKGDKGPECLELLLKNGVKCICGNHELYLLRGLEIDPDVESYRDYYDELEKILTERQKKIIASFPLEYCVECGKDKKKKIYFSHFIMENRDAPYPYYFLSCLDDGRFDAAIKDNPYDLMVLGHSHRQFVKGNVVSLPSCGLERPGYIIINADEEITYEIK